jgi:hypothetical protein
MATAAKTAKGKDLEAFRSAHDKSFIVPEKIRKGLADLGESWEYMSEFIRRIGVSQSDFAAYRQPFNDHVVETSGAASKLVIAGTKAFAAKLREKAQG